MSAPHDPLRPHTHEPNLEPPAGDGSFVLRPPDGRPSRVSVPMLHPLPATTIAPCYIVSTGHGTSGPFAFTGITLLNFLRHYVKHVGWEQVEVISVDGFGTRLTRAEVEQPDAAGPILLAYAVDGAPLTRAEGLVRLIVPSERDDALRQVKWVGQINVK